MKPIFTQSADEALEGATARHGVTPALANILSGGD